MTAVSIPLLDPPRRLVTASPDHSGIIIGHDLGYVSVVRRWVAQSARVTPSLAHDMCVAASELTTNALLYVRHEVARFQRSHRKETLMRAV